jgi:hypothetical protein
MTIKPISECPNPLEGVYNPPDALKFGCGYRLVPVMPLVQDGYTRVSHTLVDDDGEWGKWEVVDRPTADIEAEQRAADLAANGTRYALQNQYMTLCGQLTGQAPCKLGFAELQAIITAMQATDPATAMGLALQLLTLDAALKREGGLQWWDQCVWTEGLPS